MDLSPSITKPNFEQRRQIMLLRREGLAVPDIAGRLGITYQVVSNYFRRQGWRLQEPRPTWERPEAVPLTEEQSSRGCRTITWRTAAIRAPPQPRYLRPAAKRGPASIPPYAAACAA